MKSSMDQNERGIFKLHGITGMLIAVVLLLSILGVLSYYAIIVQQNEAQNYYKINQDINAIKFNSKDNYKHYTLVGKKGSE